MENFLNKKYKFEGTDEYFNDYLIAIGNNPKAKHLERETYYCSFRLEYI